MAIPSGLQVNAYEWEKGKSLYGFKKKEFIESDKFQRILRNFCDGNNITMLDLLPVFRQKSKGDLYFDFDGHLTRKGHEVVAQELWKKQLWKKLLTTKGLCDKK